MGYEIKRIQWISNTIRKEQKEKNQVGKEQPEDKLKLNTPTYKSMINIMDGIIFRSIRTGILQEDTEDQIH